MKVTHVQLVSVVADTETTRAPMNPAPSPMDEAVAQAKAFVNLMRDIAARPKEVPHNKLDNRQTTLKVLLAPEFYFRRPEGLWNGTGHFARTEFMRISSELRTGLRPILRPPKGKAKDRQPWLVIPGSVVWTSKPGADNTVLMNSIVGFDFTGPGDDPKEFWVDKQYFSAIDGLNPLSNAAAPGVARPATLGYLPSQTLELGVTTAGGAPVGVGVEICLDHRLGVLRKVFAPVGAGEQQAKAIAVIHLQIIVACGMDLMGGSVAVGPRVTGAVLRCNGNRYNGDGVAGIRSDVYTRRRMPTGGLHWERDPLVQAPDRTRYLDIGLQRPSRPAGTFDGIGVSPSYPIGDGS